ncbi:hypothetical protein ACWPKO_12515 [Coraliomargarita sp. W4R53]
MNKLCLCVSFLSLSVSLQAVTDFQALVNDDIFDGANWSNGSPSLGNSGTISMDGSGNRNQGYFWMSNSTVTVDGGATLNLDQDIGAREGVLIINNATINAKDDIFTGNSGTVIFNANSAGNSDDDFQSQGGTSALPSSLTINGGVHTSGGTFGSQGGSNFFTMVGGQITAAEFAFDGPANSIGGSAVLLGASGASTLSMSGATDIQDDWTGSWTIASFSGNAWRDELIAGGWTFDSAAIDASLFDSNFEITNGGQTLALVPEPSSSATLFGLLAMSCVILGRRRS